MKEQTQEQIIPCSPCLNVSVCVCVCVCVCVGLQTNTVYFNSYAAKHIVNNI